MLAYPEHAGAAAISRTKTWARENIHTCLRPQGHCAAPDLPGSHIEHVVELDTDFLEIAALLGGERFVGGVACEEVEGGARRVQVGEFPLPHERVARLGGGDWLQAPAAREIGT